MVASLALAVASCRLIWAIRAIASLARVTASASPSSASPRSAWTSVVMPLSCWVSTWAAVETALRAEADFRAGRQRLQRAHEIVVGGLERAGGAGRAVDALQPVVEFRAQAGIGRARAFDPHLPLDVLIELAIDRRDADAGADGAGRRSVIWTGGLADVAGRVSAFATLAATSESPAWLARMPVTAVASACVRLMARLRP